MGYWKGISMDRGARSAHRRSGRGGGSGEVLRVIELFFDKDAVLRAVDEARRQALSKAGAFIRQEARQRLRVAGRKSLSEMSKDERQIHHITAWKASKGLRAKAWRPRKHSRPGQPPRVSPGSPLKKFLYFSYDPTTQSVVIGPVGFRPVNPVPSILEFGGRARLGYVQPRPYMGPALEKVKPQIPAAWAGIIRGA